MYLSRFKIIEQKVINQSHMQAAITVLFPLQLKILESMNMNEASEAENLKQLEKVINDRFIKAIDQNSNARLNSLQLQRIIEKDDFIKVTSSKQRGKSSPLTCNLNRFTRHLKRRRIVYIPSINLPLNNLQSSNISTLRKKTKIATTRTSSMKEWTTYLKVFEEEELTKQSPYSQLLSSRKIKDTHLLLPFRNRMHIQVVPLNSYLNSLG